MSLNDLFVILPNILDSDLFKTGLVTTGIAF